MESVVRMAVVYVVLLVMLRFSGKRTLAEIDTFDFVLLLIISEATQQAILGNDFSLTNAFLTIATILFINMTLVIIKERWQGFEAYTEDVPLVLVADGRPIPDRLKKARMQADEIMQQARSTQGLERMEQIKYAVLERNGSLSIIPKT